MNPIEVLDLEEIPENLHGGTMIEIIVTVIIKNVINLLSQALLV